jgi:ketosteroid isomerase-like protein
MPPNEPAIEGAEAIQSHYEDRLGQGKVVASIRGEETVMSGNWGFERGSYSLRSTMSDGGAAEEKGKYIVLMTRQADGGLKVARLIFNSDLPMPGSPGAASR